jgi:SPP1 family predicted phage head-tail adaptor
MDMSTVITLVNETTSQDSIGQVVTTRTTSDIFAQIRSVSGNEWSNAGLNGIRASYQITVYADEYTGQQELILDGVTYEVYRTYERRDGKIELYVEKRTGSAYAATATSEEVTSDGT